MASLQTLTVEIEAHLNNRQLTYVNSELNEPEPLTPAHLLYGRVINTVPHTLTSQDELTDEDFQEASLQLHNTSQSTSFTYATFLGPVEKRVFDITKTNSHHQQDIHQRDYQG